MLRRQQMYSPCGCERNPMKAAVAVHHLWLFTIIICCCGWWMRETEAFSRNTATTKAKTTTFHRTTARTTVFAFTPLQATAVTSETTNGATTTVQDLTFKEKVDDTSSNDTINISNSINKKNQDVNAFDVLAGRAGVCLVESDMRRDAIGKAAGSQASSATNWIHDASAYALQQVMDKIQIKMPEQRFGLDRDEASSWLRWIKTVPAPLLIDLSHHVRQVVQEQVVSNSTLLHLLDYPTPNAFLQRLFGRLIILPSGMALPHALSEPPASIIYGKLLMGGVTRYRLLVSSSAGGGHRNSDGGNNAPSSFKSRRAGERKEIYSNHHVVPVWMQYGGPDRMYEAVDMGATVILEIGMLPRGKVHVAEHLLEDHRDAAAAVDGGRSSHNGGGGSVGKSTSQNIIMMSLAQMAWKPQNIFDFVVEKGKGDSSADGDDKKNNLGYTPMSLYGNDRNEAFRSDFRSQVGGLQPQIDAIVRRVLDGRIIRPAEPGESSKNKDAISAATTPSDLGRAALEAEELALLGLSPVRGLLLYGPPGCGKTALAREISKALRARAPKIISAPELLDRWVGGSERLIRELFADAESELAACNGDSTKSALHVIVIDEIDAVFRKRSAGSDDSGETTRASAVNQILAKLDGVKAIPNVLMIGMTNRRELLDEALLRPGRLEVQIEIPLPNQQGRREIMQIHFDALRKKGRLSQPLCCAIDGVRLGGSGDENRQVSKSRSGGDGDSAVVPTTTTSTRASLLPLIGTRLVRLVRRCLPGQRSPTVYDLAADYATGGFSGADIAGLVRCAGSIALARARQNGNGVEGLLITLDDVKTAILEMKGSTPI